MAEGVPENGMFIAVTTLIQFTEQRDHACSPFLFFCFPQHAILTGCLLLRCFDVVRHGYLFYTAEWNRIRFPES